jgi:hypothetical protein
MTERTVTIKLDLQDPGIADQLMKIRKQRDALNNSKIKIGIDSAGLDQVRRASAQASAASATAIKDFGLLGSAITSKAIQPLQQYQNLLGSVAHAGKAVGPGIVSALARVSSEFERQRTLAQFWGTSGYLHQGLGAFKSAIGNFVATGGAGFGGWIQNSISSIASYRTALVGASAVLVGFAAAAALSSKHAQNYISSTLDSRLMARKLPDKEGAAKWIESAQSTDWSKGAESRMGVFQTVLSKNKGMGQQAAQKATEDIERYFFANQEMFQKKGIASAEEFASRVSAPTLSGEDASIFEDIYGLGFSNLSSTARLSRVGTEAQGIDIDKEVAKRPDVVLSDNLAKGTRAVGDAALPALNAVLGTFLKVVDVVKKIPGLGKAMGWGAVLLGAASAGLVMVSMVGSLIPGLITVAGVLSKLGIVTRLAAAGQWVLNAAMSANPLGIAIIAIAGLVTALYILEKKFGLVTKAWQAFSGSSIGKGIIGYIEQGKKALEDMLGSLGKAYASGGLKGVLKVGLEALVANSPMLKMIAFVVEFLRKIWANSATLNKLIGAASTLWTMVSNFILGLWNTIKSMWSWFISAIPGAEKEVKRQEFVAQAKKEKLGVTPAGSLVELDANGQNTKISASGKASSRLLQLQSEYNALPGFAEGVAEAVKQGVSSIGTTIATAITGALSGIGTTISDAISSIPGFDALAKAMGELQKKLGDVIDKLKTYLPDWVTGDGSDDTSTPPSSPVPTSAAAPTEYVNMAGDVIGADVYNGLAADQQAYWKPKMDKGGQIRVTGSLIGHQLEEVDPAQVVQGGKTTLAKINEMFAGMSGTGAGGQPITVNAPITLNVAKIDSSVDLEKALAKAGEEFDRKLLFRLRNSLEGGSTRGIGYLRG